ncbi:MAG TPA: hypothetical protein VM008_20995 [Phycisphaerae bacterium]|nr:hypothetical protein [Phycisphaerae bacterium]
MTVLEQEKEVRREREPGGAREVSRRIAVPLHQVAGRARVLSFLLAMFQVMVLTLCAWLVIVLLLGGIREIALPAAFGLAGVAWVVLLGGGFLLFRPALRGTTLTAAARLVDTAMPDTDERISSALELSQEEDTRFQGSPELIAVLVRQAEHAAESLDPNAIVSGKRVFHWFLGTIPLLLAWFVLFVVMTPTMMLGMERLFQPWLAAAPLQTATLEVEPKNVTVAQGDELPITVTVTPLGVTAAEAEKPVKSATITRRYTGGNTNEDVTTDMERTGNHAFVAHVENIQQSFSYRIAALGTQSPTYTVTVDPRPGVSGIQIDYTYPAYTNRSPQSDTSRDGTVDALVGTLVKLTIDSNQPVKSARIVITDNAPDPGALVLQPVDRTETKFTTEFVVRKTTDYKIELINEHELENKEPQAHQIIARLDAPPTVAITSPTEPVLKVRPDDTVAVRFTATDDQALTKIEAITQADDQPEITFLLPQIPTKTTTFNGTWTISPRDVLGAAIPGRRGVKRITYQLRATDNRDPDAQVGLSAKQTLELDDKVAPLADRQDTQAARTLGEAVQQAAKELEDAKAKLDTLRQTAAARPLTEEEKQQAADARSEINRAGQKLQDAADKTSDSSMAGPAKQAKEIANETIRQAEENTAGGQLYSDEPDARSKKFDAASQNLADAHDRLEQLARDIDTKAKDQPVARELQRIAAEQKKLAEQLASRPNDPALLAKQRQLQQDLDNVIKQHPELQKPAEEAAKGETQDVQKKLDDLSKSQQPFNEQAKSQADAAVAQDKLNDLAKQQEQLNQQIKDFNGRNPGARTPPPAQLDAIPKDLRERNLPGATQGQNATANQLEQSAQQLENAQRRENSGETGARDAGDLQNQASQLQKQIEEAQRNHNPPTRPSDPANQQANRLADETKRIAQQQAAQSPSQRNAAKQATEEADAAKRAAAQGDAASAQRHLSSAANTLAAASGQNTLAGQEQSGASAAKAAEEARQLAQQQRNISDQTSQTNRSLESAADARNNSGQSAEEQQKLADQMESAARSARELQQKTQGSAPDLSQRAGRAAQQLENAAQAQRAASEATRSGNASQAQSRQAQAARSLESAKQQMGQSGGQAGGEQTANQQSPSQAGGPSGQQANAPSGGKASQGGGSAAKGPQQSGGPTSPIGQMGQAPGGSAGQGEASSAARIVQSARDAQSEAASGNPAAAQQAAEQLSQASEQLLNGPPSQSGASNRQQSGTPASGSGNSGNAGSARGGDQSKAPGEVANGKGGGGASPGGLHGSTGATGIAPAKNATEHAMPKAVEDVGIAPSDWAKLPPTMQEQLLNSAQQSGPPAYREMIKNYYSRIAQLEQQPQGDK